jgi:hypothetical protein
VAAQQGADTASSPTAAVERLIRESLEFLTRPEEAVEDRGNSVAQAWKEKVGDSLGSMRLPHVQKRVAESIVRDAPALQGVPAEIRTALVDALALGSKLRGQTSFYQALKAVTRLVADPLAWVHDEVLRVVPEAFIFWTRELAYDFIGMDRIGCHSLMAKDHGAEPLYAPNRECATAVDYLIVNTLLTPRPPGPRPEVDWLALLEFYLQNPLSATPGRSGGKESKFSVSVVHVVRPGERLAGGPDPQTSLTARYQRTATNPPAFTWRTIADANFHTWGLPDRETQRVINETLRRSHSGTPVKPPNYAFTPGATILIPAQEHRLQTDSPDRADRAPWFVDVMDRGWTVVRGDSSGVRAAPPSVTPYVPARISRDEATLMIDTARRMRTNARRSYRGR